MAYFPNGTAGLSFIELNCQHCVNWRDLGDGCGHGCPVMDVHVLFAYEECNSKSNAKTILDTLIDDEKGCSMFIPAHSLVRGRCRRSHCNNEGDPQNEGYCEDCL